jgi:hypothetical protein
MGDCGSYNASVHIEYSLRKKEKNTEEECKTFIETGVSMEESSKVSEEIIKDLYDKNLKFDLYYKDWEEWSSDNMSLEDMLDALEEYYGNDEYSITIFKTPEMSDIAYLDLELAKGMKSLSKDLKADTKPILDVYASIYCENDNSCGDSKSLKTLEKYLSLPDARLVLSADGSGNC